MFKNLPNAAIATTLLLLAACSGAGKSDGGSTCTPGASVSCACVGGAQGAQVCNATGLGFDTCQCPGGTSGTSGTSSSTLGGSTTGSGSSTGSPGSSSSGTVASTTSPGTSGGTGTSTRSSGTKGSTSGTGSSGSGGTTSGATGSGGSTSSGFSGSGGADGGIHGQVGTPCLRNADCLSGYCTQVGGPVDGGWTGYVCSEPCNATTDCVPGWACVPVAGITSSNFCTCTYSPQVCDGKDDNCDGTVDNEPAADESCGPAFVCQDGGCACSQSACSSLDGGGACCSNLCVDLQTDSAHCGSCGNQCSAAQACRPADGGAATCAAVVCGGSAQENSACTNSSDCACPAACVAIPGQGSFCLRPCSSYTDCHLNEICDAQLTPQSCSQNLCSPGVNAPWGACAGANDPSGTKTGTCNMFSDNTGAAFGVCFAGGTVATSGTCSDPGTWSSVPSQECVIGDFCGKTNSAGSICFQACDPTGSLAGVAACNGSTKCYSFACDCSSDPNCQCLSDGESFCDPTKDTTCDPYSGVCQ